MSRAFIIGNGPSLKETPMDLLIGEDCFATNEIRFLYDKTEWRPTHFICSLEEWDLNVPLLYSWWWHNFVTHMEMGTATYVNRGHNSRVDALMWRNPDADIRPIAGCGHFRTHYDDPDAPTEWHDPPLCTYGSTLHVGIQLAIKEGKYEELVLVGCDLGYGNGQDHFVDDYVGNRGEFLRDAKYANGDCVAAHEVAKRSSPIPIYNATIGGELEVYERVDLMEVINA